MRSKQKLARGTELQRRGKNQGSTLFTWKRKNAIFETKGYHETNINKFIFGHVTKKIRSDKKISRKIAM